MAINLDTATIDVLKTIQNVGEVSASNIVDTRNKYGPIRTWAAFKKNASRVVFDDLIELHRTGAVTSSIPIMNSNLDFTNDAAKTMALMSDQMDALATSFSRQSDEVRGSIDAHKKEVNGKLDQLRKEVDDKFEGVTNGLNDYAQSISNEVIEILDRRLAETHSGRPKSPRWTAPILKTKLELAPEGGRPSSHRFSFSEDPVEDMVDSPREFKDKVYSNTSFMRGKLEGSHYVSHDIKLAGLGRGRVPSGLKSKNVDTRSKESEVKREGGTSANMRPIANVEHPRPGSYCDRDDSSEDFSEYSADEEPDARAPQGYSMDARNIRLEYFDGKVGEWDDWFHKFKYIARACGWTRRERLFRLTTSLRFAALTAHRNLPSHVRNNFDQICKAFKKRYGKARWSTKAGLRAQLSSIQQKEGEDLEVFADRVHALVIDAHPKGTPSETTEMYSVEHFLAGCKDKRAALLTFSTHFPESLFDAVERMRLIQASSQRLGFKQELRHVTFDSLPGMESASTVRSLNTANPDACHTCGGRGHYANDCPNRRRRSPSPLNCYNCNGRGHVARECSSKRSSSQSPNRRGGGSPSPNRSDSPNWRNQSSNSPNWRSRPTAKQSAPGNAGQVMKKGTPEEKTLN